MKAHDAARDLDAFMAVEQGRRLPVIKDASECVSVTRAARQVPMDTTRGKLSALAIVTGAGLGVVVGNVCLALFSNDSTPSRFFREFGEAVTWAKGFVNP